jgi:prephenate dehydrogenase
MRWRKVSLIGVGLLGGSLGLALRKRALAGEVTGYVRREESIREAIGQGAVDSATVSLAESVNLADLVVLCTPLAQMENLSRLIAPHLAKDALLTDVGSVKGSLVRQLEPIYGERGNIFVGSHPMAGSEKMGVSAARADLFENATCVVTPTAKCPESATARIEELWRSVGGRVMRLEPSVHDELVSRSSHLPHVLAAALARFVLDPKFPEEQAGLCANGFKDSTRIAASSPEMWRDIIMANREEIAVALRDYAAELGNFSELMARQEGEAILEFFSQSKALRDGWAAQGSSLSPE